MVTAREELVRRAIELVPMLRDRAAATETQRSLPQETIADFRAAELLRATTPERFGGLGFDYDITLDVALELGRGCGSAAWCYAVWADISWMLGMYPEKAQQEYWVDSADTLCASGFNPGGGNATPVDGGYLLSGHWDFASGCDAASWVLVGAMDGPVPLLILVPKSDFTIQDTWYVSGLRGTGSKDIVVQEAFVPDYRALSITDMAEARTPGRKLHDTPGYRIPFWSTVPYVLVSPIIGMAQGALETFEASIASKISEKGSAADYAGIQMSLAEAAVEIHAARLIIRHDTQETLTRAGSNEMPSVDDRVRYRRNQAYVATLGVRAMNRLFEASGAHVLFDSDPIQRFHRDANAASHHFTFSWHVASEQYGRVRLGLEPTNVRF